MHFQIFKNTGLSFLEDIPNNNCLIKARILRFYLAIIKWISLLNLLITVVAILNRNILERISAFFAGASRFLCFGISILIIYFHPVSDCFGPRVDAAYDGHQFAVKVLLFLLLGLRSVGQLRSFLRELIQVILIDSDGLNIKSQFLAFVEHLLLLFLKVTVLTPATRCGTLSLLDVYRLHISHHAADSL